MKSVIAIVCVIALVVSPALAKEPRECPPGFEMKNKECVYKNKEYYNCKAGEYAKGSTSKCDTMTLVFGKGNWPADTKTTRVWWKANAQQKTCAKTHNVRPGIYCKVGRGALTTFEDAKNICLGAKGRLCTFEELKAGDTRGTGCDYNWKRVWSSTPCGNNKVWTTSGAAEFAKKIGGHKCMARSSKKAVVRCCMDDPFDGTNNPQCTACPPHTTSSAGAAGEDECRCANGEKSDGSGCKEVSRWNKKNCGGGQFRAGSLETCANLNNFKVLDSVKNSAGNKVCVSNTRSDGSCFPKTPSYNVAKDFCESQGARLCSVNEVKTQGVGGGLGCNAIGQKVWTSTRCSSSKLAQVYNAKNGKVECVKDDAKAAADVICCAETAQHCENCPQHHDGSSGLDDVYECKPKDGYRNDYPLTTQLQFIPSTVECKKDYYSESSMSSCTDLGWNRKKGKNKNVCAASEIDGQCSGKVDYETAKSFCESKGARLCTGSEILDDEAFKSGCNYDKRRVWTSSPCNGKGGFTGQFTVGGNSRVSKRIPGRCDKVTKLAFTRCCADEEPKCTKCPMNSGTSGAGAKSRSDCKCKPGFNGVAGGLCSPPTKAPTKKSGNKNTKPPTKMPDSCFPGQFLAGSSKSCGFHGLNLHDSLRNGESKRVCGTVRSPDRSKCLNNGDKMTYDDAKSFCEAKSMRLCSGMELVEKVPLNNKGKDTTCFGTESKPKYFWSNKPCHEDPKWEGDKNAKREIFYHVVKIPYTGIPRPNGTPKGSGPMGNRIDMEQAIYPETTNDRCESRKPSLDNQNHVACCADANARYCKMCPRNSCRDFPCKAGATANTDCPCDLKDETGTVDKFYNYNIKTFKVCVPAEITDSPTNTPTRAPTKSPTKEPGADLCPAGEYFNAAAGATPLDKKGKSISGSWACNYGTKNAVVYGKKYTTSWHKNNPKPDWGPTVWKQGCRGKCLPEFGVDGSDCKQNTYKNEWSEQKICVATDTRGSNYYRDFGAPNGQTWGAYVKDQCTGLNKKGATSGNCCSKTKSWDDAKKFCSAIGGRLCVASELENSCAERTGCDYDYTWVWSADECNGPRGAGHWAYPGDQRKWTRKMPGDCKYKTSDNAMDGHKACSKSNAQGMPNKNDAIPYTTGQKTGMGDGSKFPDWIPAAGERFLYLDAMKQLFGWKNSEDWDAPANYPDVTKTPNPLEEGPTYGKTCLTSAHKVFVRCCADFGPACLKCPAGKTNAAGSGKDFYTCQ